MSADVCVVIPVRNGERYLSAALESVLAQPTPVERIVVVDDGSTDGSAALARSYGKRVLVVDNAGTGPGAARNTGVAATHSTLLAFLDADDLWATDALGLRLRRMHEADAPDIVRGRVVEFVSPDIDPATPAPVAAPGSTPGHVLGASLIRRSVWDLVGPLREDLRVGEFIDWAARAHESNVAGVDIDDVVLHRRLHATNLGRNDDGARVDLTRVVRAALQRRRGAGT